MPARKQRSPRVSRNEQTTQESFASDTAAADTPVKTPEKTRNQQGVDLCRCRKAARAAGALFCSECHAEYSKLWTTPPARGPLYFNLG